MKTKVITLVLLFLSITNGQSFRITKILETNLFELDNGAKVRLYGLYIPDTNDTNEVISYFAKNLLQWEQSFLLNQKFDFIFLNINDDGTNNVKAYKSYFFSKSDIATQFLSQGYAILLNNIDQNYYDELINEQQYAQKNKIGIWGADLTQLENLNIQAPISKELIASISKKYERPYISLLAVSLASFALAWDSFSSANDIQETMDLMKKIDKNYNTSDLESSKTRKTIVGITCIAAGIITTLFSFKSVEVKTNLQSLSLSYNF